VSISVVQVVPVTNGTTTSTTLTFTIASTTAGNSVILVLNYEYSANITASSAKLGTTNLSKHVSEENATYHGYAEVWSLDNIASGQTTVTITWASAVYSAGWVFEVSGLLSTGSFDKSAEATASSGTPITVGPTVTLSNASEFVVGTVNGFSTAALTGPVASSTFTATSASPCVFTAATPTGFTNNTPVTLTGGSLPAGFSTGTTYYLVSATATTFELAATVGGTAIGSTSTGSGTVTPAVPWTNEANQTYYTGSGINAICSYQIVTDTGAVTYQVKPNTSNYYTGSVGTFQAAAAAAFIAPPPLVVGQAGQRSATY
jgi:hypothetical protein